jgi:hypothetical protein
MDCLRFSLLPSILGNLTGKHSIVNTVSIPNRGYRVKQAFVDLFSSLLIWAVRHKRLRTVAEVSIPNRGYSLPIKSFNSDCTLISQGLTLSGLKPLRFFDQRHDLLRQDYSNLSRGLIS